MGLVFTFFILIAMVMCFLDRELKQSREELQSEFDAKQKRFNEQWAEVADRFSHSGSENLVHSLPQVLKTEQRQSPLTGQSASNPKAEEWVEDELEPVFAPNGMYQFDSTRRLGEITPQWRSKSFKD